VSQYCPSVPQAPLWQVPARQPWSEQQSFADVHAAGERPHRFVQEPDGQPKPWQHWLEAVQAPIQIQGLQWPVASQFRAVQSNPMVHTSPFAREPETHTPFVHRRGELPSQQSLLVVQVVPSGLQSQVPEVQLPEQHAVDDEQLAWMAPQAGFWTTGGATGVAPPPLQPARASASDASEPRTAAVSWLFTTPPGGPRARARRVRRIVADHTVRATGN
jgi:hypothetical protein